MREYQKLRLKHKFPYDSVFSLLYYKFLENPNRDFVISLYKDTVEKFSYKDFFVKVISVRDYLSKKGLNKEDCINIIMQNSADFLILYFAALSLGIIVCPINYNLSPKEISYIVNDSKSKILFVDYEYLPKIEEIKERFASDFEVVVFSKNDIETNYFNLFSIYKNSFDIKFENINKEVFLIDKAVIIYTSGTSGNPKGAILTHANLLSDAQAIAEWFKFDINTRALCILPLFHNNGQIVTLLAPLWAGGSTVMIKGNVSLMSFWDLVNKYNVTWTSVIPTILSVLINFNIKRKDNILQGIICGGALLPKRVQIDFEEKYKVPIYEGYGLTETTSFSCFNPIEVKKRRIGSIGLPLPINKMAIFDENGIELPDNEIGEMCIKGYNVFLEYCNLHEKNASVFKNGWFHSGDYGYRDSDGFFYIRGRKDDMIIKGGENIYPREIENLIYTNPKIKDCALIGVEHKLWGEDLVLFIEQIENQKVNKMEIIDFLIGKIADFKIPSEIYFINELEDLSEMPKGPTKKILRKELKKYYETHLRK